jgi:hypothetical protein
MSLVLPKAHGKGDEHFCFIPPNSAIVVILAAAAVAVAVPAVSGVDS